ncbi:MAG: AEC family transporter [Treponema sp.]|nr:AEC family transporter [Treponema sp.]
MEAVSPVLVLFFLILTGFICAKLKVTGPAMAGNLSTLVINVTLPAMLFSSFIRPFSQELLREAGLAFALSVLLYGLSFLIAFFYPRLLGIKGPERGVHRYTLIISNCGFIGYPMVEALIGPAFLFHAVIFNIPYSFLAFSVCAWLIAKEGRLSIKFGWKTFVNPNVVATFLGLIFFLLSINIPDPLFRSIKMAGDMTSPLSMIVIGTTLAQAKFSNIFGRWQVYITVAMRLLILPLLAGLILYFLGIRGPLFMMAVLITAMPAGSSTSILATLYDTTTEEASSLVFLSTMLCMATIPLVMIIAKNFM